MKAILICFQLLIIVSTVYSQEQKQLVVIDHVKGTNRYFDEQQRIKVWVDDKMYDGKFEIVNDSTIAINQVNIPIKDITQFKGRTKKAIVTGSLLIGVPVLFSGVTYVLAFVENDYGYAILTLGGVIAGVITAPIGTVLIVSSKKKIEPGGRLKLTIE